MMTWSDICIGMEWGFLYIPTDTNSEGTIVPVSAFDQRHLTVDVGAWTIEDIV